MFEGVTDRYSWIMAGTELSGVRLRGDSGLRYLPIESWYRVFRVRKAGDEVWGIGDFFGELQRGFSIKSRVLMKLGDEVSLRSNLERILET